MRRLTALSALALALTAACASSENATDPLAPAAAAIPAAEAGTNAAGVRLVAIMAGTGQPSSKGKSVWRARQNGRRELEFEAQALRRFAGQAITFRLGGVAVGTGIVDAAGVARLSLSTQRGDAVPAAVTGQSVEALSPAGLQLCAGSF